MFQLALMLVMTNVYKIHSFFKYVSSVGPTVGVHVHKIGFLLNSSVLHGHVCVLCHLMLPCEGIKG